METMPAKLCVFPVRVEIRPHSNIAAEMYSDGREIRLMNMFDGTCMRIYPTYDMNELAAAKSASHKAFNESALT